MLQQPIFGHILIQSEFLFPKTNREIIAIQDNENKMNDTVSTLSIVLSFEWF